MANQLGTTLAQRDIDSANCLMSLSLLILLSFAHSFHFPRLSKFTWETTGHLCEWDINVGKAFPGCLSSDMWVTDFLLTIDTFEGSDVTPLWLSAVALGAKYKPAWVQLENESWSQPEQVFCIGKLLSSLGLYRNCRSRIPFFFPY